MTKKQIKDIIKLLKTHKVQEEKKDKAWTKYAEIEFYGQYTPFFVEGKIELAIKALEIVDRDLADIISYLFGEVGDGDKNKQCISFGNDLDKEKNIKRKDLEKYIINEYGE